MYDFKLLLPTLKCFAIKFSGIPSIIPKIHHILILIQAVDGVYTNKNENCQLNYSDYISLFTNT